MVTIREKNPAEFPEPSNFDAKKMKVADALSKKQALHVHHMQTIINPDMKKEVEPSEEIVHLSKLEEMANSPETTEIKNKYEHISNLFAALVSGFGRAVSFLNVFAYFNKQQPTTIKEKIAIRETEKREKLPASPEKLSQAVKAITDYFSEHLEELRTEGIFYQSGSEKEINQLLKKVAEPQAIPVSSLARADALKRIVSQLELFGADEELRKQFLAVGTEIRKGISQNTTVYLLTDLVDRLPNEQKENLKNIIKLLGIVSEHEKLTKLDAPALGQIFGPRLIENHSDTEDALKKMVRETGVSQAVVEKLILLRHQVFA